MLKLLAMMALCIGTQALDCIDVNPYTSPDTTQCIPDNYPGETHFGDVKCTGAFGGPARRCTYGISRNLSEGWFGSPVNICTSGDFGLQRRLSEEEAETCIKMVTFGQRLFQSDYGSISRRLSEGWIGSPLNICTSGDFGLQRRLSEEETETCIKVVTFGQRLFQSDYGSISRRLSENEHVDNRFLYWLLQILNDDNRNDQSYDLMKEVVEKFTVASGPALEYAENKAMPPHPVLISTKRRLSEDEMKRCMANVSRRLTEEEALWTCQQVHGAVDVAGDGLLSLSTRLSEEEGALAALRAQFITATLAGDSNNRKTKASTLLAAPAATAVMEFPHEK